MHVGTYGNKKTWLILSIYYVCFGVIFLSKFIEVPINIHRVIKFFLLYFNPNYFIVQTFLF